MAAVSDAIRRKGLRSSGTARHIVSSVVFYSAQATARSRESASLHLPLCVRAVIVCVCGSRSACARLGLSSGVGRDSRMIARILTAGRARLCSHPAMRPIGSPLLRGHWCSPSALCRSASFFFSLDCRPRVSRSACIAVRSVPISQRSLLGVLL